MNRAAADCSAGGPLKCGAASAALAREDLVLVGAELLEQTNVFIVNVRRSRATLPGAEAAAILAVTTKSLPRHFLAFLSKERERMGCPTGEFVCGKAVPGVHLEPTAGNCECKATRTFRQASGRIEMHCVPHDDREPRRVVEYTPRGR